MDDATVPVRRALTPAQLAALEAGRKMRWARRPRKFQEPSALERKAAMLTPQSPEVRRIVAEVLAELTQPQPQDAALVVLLAMSLHLARLAASDIMVHGFERDGELRPSVKLFLDASRRAAELCDRLGIGAAARAKLGLGKPAGNSLGEALRRAAAQGWGEAA